MIAIEKIMQEAVKYDGSDVKRINHFLKVYAFAKMIGKGEKLAPNEQFTLEAAAILHDIGIHESERKYGSSSGKYQEIEGPPVAEKILKRLCVESDIVDRVCFLIGHHHTYSGVDGKDYQILIEADFLVNAFEDSMNGEALHSAYEKIFKTETGKNIFQNMYSHLIG